jgi:hypothetical protein
MTGRGGVTNTSAELLKRQLFPFGPGAATRSTAGEPAHFLVTSCGHSGSVWLAASLNLHDAVCATAGIDSPAESFTYYPLNRPIECFTYRPLRRDPDYVADRANPDWRTYGFSNSHRIEFVDFVSELRGRGLDIPPRDVSRLPWYVFDELEQMLSVAPYEVLGNVHGIWFSQMQQACLADPDILKGRSVVVMDLIRHPVGRTESAIKATMTFHLPDLDPVIDEFIRANAKACLALERKYTIDFSEPRARAALHVYRQGLQNDVWAYEVREFPDAQRILLERLQADPAYYAQVFSILSQGRLTADRAYLDRVFAPANLGGGRRSTSNIARPPDTAEQYELWPPWERDEFASVSQRLYSPRVYFPFGYDFSFLTAGTPGHHTWQSGAPRVSVFLTARHSRQTVRWSVDRVLAQTYRDLECVILEGTGADTLDVPRPDEDDRISRPDAFEDTRSTAFWRTISRCRSEYVCACLSGESLMPRAIEDAVAALDAHPDAVAVTRDVALTSPDGRTSVRVRGRPFDLLAYMTDAVSPVVAGAVFRRSSLESAGLATREADPICRDFEFWCRLALMGPILRLADVGATSARHPNDLVPDAAQAIRVARGHRQAIARIASETTPCDGTRRLLRAGHISTTLRLARQLVAAGAPGEAVDLYLSVADESGVLPEPKQPESPATDYVRMAHRLRLDGHEQLALDILKTSITLMNVEASVAFEIGQMDAAAGRVDRALEMYRAALQIDPGFLDAHWERGLLMERRGQIDEALEAWRLSDVTRDKRRHSLYVAAALKSPRSTNESLLEAHREWARHHTGRTSGR